MTQTMPINEDEILITAMTRPTMLGGFTLTSLFLSFYIPGMITMLTRSMLALLLIPIFLLLCYFICLKDVYIFDIAGAASRLKPCRNKKLWGYRSYAPR